MMANAFDTLPNRDRQALELRLELVAEYRDWNVIDEAICPVCIIEIEGPGCEMCDWDPLP